MPQSIDTGPNGLELRRRKDDFAIVRRYPGRVYGHTTTLITIRASITIANRLFRTMCDIERELIPQTATPYWIEK